PRANAEFIGVQRLPIPPVHEQITISTFLDRITFKIDQAIAIKEKQIALLQDRKQILIQNAVTRGLDPDAPMRDSGVEWIGEIPAHWKLKKMSHLTKKIGDGLHGTPEYSDNTSYYFINGNNLVGGRIKINEMTKTVSERQYLIHKKELNSDTLLISINGTIGNVAVYQGEKVMLGKSAAYLNFLPHINIEYIKAFLESSIFKHYYELELSGSTIWNLSLFSLGKTPIIYPPIDEQTAIVAHIQTQSTKIDNAITLQQQQIEKLKEYKATLINSAVTGKFKVPMPLGDASAAG
ncbi:MAG: restriction endonuclease subunit S, partial [Thermodesulfobacteriota bacterium]